MIARKGYLQRLPILYSYYLFKKKKFYVLRTRILYKMYIRRKIKITVLLAAKYNILK